MKMKLDSNTHTHTHTHTHRERGGKKKKKKKDIKRGKSKGSSSPSLVSFFSLSMVKYAKVSLAKNRSSSILVACFFFYRKNSHKNQRGVSQEKKSEIERKRQLQGVIRNSLMKSQSETIDLQLLPISTVQMITGC